MKNTVCRQIRNTQKGRRPPTKIMGPRLMGKRGFLLLVWILTIPGCGPIQDEYPLLPEDLSPPIFLKAETGSENSIALRFNEEVEIFEDSTSLSPHLTVESVEKMGTTLVLTVEGPLEPGREYILSSVVRDETGNTTGFTTPFYGHNPNLPELLLNEFTTQGSSSHPDVMELLALTEGNIAGICVYEGTPGNWEQRIILPSVWIEQDDFILIHWKPEGIPEETNETTDKDESGGLDASDTAYDFWVYQGSGLGGNNGVLTVTEYPGGPIMDGVLYSNRSSESDEHYRGFGSSKTRDRADELVAAGEWTAGGALVAPEDAIDPEDSTATRSICRGTDRSDTNTAADWHITPTSGYSFGEENTDEVYQ